MPTFIVDPESFGIKILMCFWWKIDDNLVGPAGEYKPPLFAWTQVFCPLVAVGDPHSVHTLLGDIIVVVGQVKVQ